MEYEKLEAEYLAQKPLGERLVQCMKSELGRLLTEAEISLGVPIEGRVKELSSLSDKIEQKELKIDHVIDLHDFVGIRLILLFSKDLKLVHDIIHSNVNVISFENTADRLSDQQFGYQSNHYVAKLPTTWLSVPTYRDLGHLQMEIQVRTLSQHIWAAASHKLQYKQEESVPGPLKRTIHRASALLELVDMEFDKVLSSRENYITEIKNSDIEDESLNVDVLAKIISETFPKDNIEGNENYSILLREIIDLGINSAKDLREILNHQKDRVLNYEKGIVDNIKDGKRYYRTSNERMKRGVFLNGVGLVRRALVFEFGRQKVTENIIRNRK